MKYMAIVIGVSATLGVAMAIADENYVAMIWGLTVLATSAAMWFQSQQIETLKRGKTYDPYNDRRTAGFNVYDNYGIGKGQDRKDENQ